MKRFFRRKSNAEVELQKDFPTYSDQDDFTDDERRRREWQENLNRRDTAGELEHYTNIRDENWDYESEYNYSVGSESSIVDAFRENSYLDSPRIYSDRDLERQIEHAMRKDYGKCVDWRRRQSSFPSSEDSRLSPFQQCEDRRKGSYPSSMFERRGSLPAQDYLNGEENRGFKERGRRKSVFKRGDDKWEQFDSEKRPQLSPVTERVRQFELKFGKKRASLAPVSQLMSLPRRRESSDNNTPLKSPGKKKVRKQVWQRKRARDVSPDLSDEEDAKKYSVNLTMDDLNELIKKNIDSAVKTIASQKSTSKKHFSPSDSFSTESETIFSGSSSHSTDIPSGLLKKQIKAQLDKDKLRGIIKNAVAKEARSVLQKSVNVSTSPVFPQINEIPATPTQTPAPSPYSCNYRAQQQHPVPHYVNSSPMPTSHIPPAPPAPPAPPLPAPTAAFNIPRGAASDIAMFSQYETLNLPNSVHRSNSDHNSFDNFENSFTCNNSQERNYSNYHTHRGISQAALTRLQSRRHTLAALDTPSDIATLAEDKMEQFSNALELLNKTIKQAENNLKGTEDDKKELENNESKKAMEERTSGSQAPPPVGVLAPVQSIADQIAALSKKKKKSLEIGQIPMSACARTFLILSNILFLIVGGGLSGLGVWMMTDPNIETYFDILNVDKSSSNFKLICYALIVVGAFAFLIAFLGCCGAVQQSKCLLTMFLIMVAVLTVLEAGIGAMVIIGKDSTTALPVLSSFMSDVEEKLKIQMKLSITKYYLPETLIGTTWDMIQIQLECCGAVGPGDYQYSRWKNETRPETDYPDTCCVLMSKDAEVPEPSNKLLCHFGTAGFYFETGCYDKMVGWFKDNSVYVIGSFSAILTMEVFGFVSAFLICKKAVNQKAKDAKRQSSKES